MKEAHTLYEITKDILIPSGGIIFSFIAILIAIRSLNATNKVAQANFELQMTLSHRETWQKIGELGLTRIKDPSANPNELTELEFLHTNFVLHNVKNMYDAIQHGILRRNRKKVHMKDIGEFFSLPIPNMVWSRLKDYHDVSFQRFIEDSKKISRNEPPTPVGIKRYVCLLMRVSKKIGSNLSNIYKVSALLSRLRILLIGRFNNLRKTYRNRFTH